MLLTPFLSRSYWKVVLTTGRVLSEMDIVSSSLLVGEPRPADWTLDLISTGDINRVKEVHLICPGFFKRAILEIDDPGTAFQFKNGNARFLGSDERSMEAQIIGRITDKMSGACDCFVWDRVLGLIKYHANIYRFGSWHLRIAPIGKLSQEVIGLRLA